eukprot:COSAG05_NODE_10503_length_562_cov_0.585313_1_plen_28_part_10
MWCLVFVGRWPTDTSHIGEGGIQPDPHT